jgi:hypothetical protein
MRQFLTRCIIPRKLPYRLHYASLSSIDSQDLLSQLINHEQTGIPKGAGTAGADAAFDLGRMHRLLAKLGDPHKALRAIHIAGSKGMLENDTAHQIICFMAQKSDSAPELTMLLLAVPTQAKVPQPH